MRHQLNATTEAGKNLVALATSLADEFAPNVAAYDRDGSYPFDHLEKLKTSGYLYAPFRWSLAAWALSRRTT